MTTEEKIKKRLSEAKEALDNGDITVIEYNKFVRHCRKLLTLLQVREGATN